MVFDLGGVLIYIHPERAFDIWGKASGASRQEMLDLYRRDKLYCQMECGKISLEDYHRYVVEQLGRPMELATFIRGWNSMIGDIMPGVEALLDKLAGKVRLVCLSNTNAAHAECFKRSLTGLLGRFEKVFCSHEMAGRKPEPQIYLDVLSYLKLPASQVAFIDDREENVAGAAAVGMRGVLSRSVEETFKSLEMLGITLQA